MAVDIKVPSVGEAITEGVISKWFKADGEAVRANEPVYELETDKATTEVVAPAAGVLSITAKEGQTVAVGAVVGRIEEGAVPAAKPKEAAPPVAAAKPAPAAKTAVAAEPLLSPSARQMVADAGVDPAKLTGTGREGRVIKEDVQAFLAQRGEKTDARSEPAAVETKPAANGRETTRQRMTTIRQRTGERLLAAQQNAAILTTFNEADMSAVMALRTKYKESFQKKHGVGLGFMSFFVKACVEALRAFPAVNARIDGTDIVYHNYHDIGVAVSTEQRFDGSDAPRRRPDDLRSNREGHRRSCRQSARRKNRGGGSAGRHVHDHQRRSIRIAIIHADPEPAAERHPWNAQHSEAAGRGER